MSGVLFLRKDGSKFYDFDPRTSTVFKIHEGTKEFETYLRRLGPDWIVWYEEV